MCNTNKIIKYKPKLKQIARKLRKQGILSEVLLWKELKGKKLLGYDFHRQKPLRNFVVDFFCHELMLAIEIDGASHNENYENDKKRQEDLEAEGINFLRYYDGHIKQHLGDVVANIKEWIIKYELEHTPFPLKRSHPSPEGN